MDLYDAGTHRFLGMEGPPSFVHLASVIEESDMRQDSAEAVVSMRQIVLQGDGTLEFCNRFQMLKVFRWSPEQKSPGHVAFGKVRIYFQRALAVKFSLFQPRASWIEFEMASGAHQRKNGVAESKARISTYSIGQVIGGFFDHRRIATSAEPIT